MLTDAQRVLPLEAWTAIGGFLLAMLLQRVAAALKVGPHAAKPTQGTPVRRAVAQSLPATLSATAGRAADPQSSLSDQQSGLHEHDSLAFAACLVSCAH